LIRADDAVKRSRSIRLVLMGGLSVGTLAGCGPSSGPVSTSDVFTNNHYMPGVGYYHAPYHAWYSLPYNHYDSRSARYFHGGQWAPAPHESIINISSPTPDAVRQVAGQRTDIRRGGFGSSSRSSWISS
jgi:hypothetical protein